MKYGLAVAWIAVAVAYYLKVPAVREAVDSRLPWMRKAERVAVAPALPAPATQITTAKVSEAEPTPIPAPSVAPVTPVARVAEPPPIPATVESAKYGDDLQALALERDRWPRTVHLNRQVTFPAVIDGKVIGKVQLAPGSVVNLVAISAGKVGLEYRGGGAWVNPDQTDLWVQVRLAKQLQETPSNAAR